MNERFHRIPICNRFEIKAKRFHFGDNGNVALLIYNII